MLLERDEGTLTALSVSPLTPAGYLATRTVSLTILAAVETIALVLIAFHPGDRGCSSSPGRWRSA